MPTSLTRRGRKRISGGAESTAPLLPSHSLKGRGRGGVKGKDEDLPALKKAGWTDAFITVGSIGSTSLRQRLYQMVVSNGLTVPAIIDATAIIAQDAKVAAGCIRWKACGQER